MSKRIGARWQPPVNLGSPINTGGEETQPFVTDDGAELYFRADNRDGIGGPAIFRSKRQGDSWSKPELVASGIVGEPTLTADKQSLYFVHIILQGSKLVGADIMVARRKE